MGRNHLNQKYMKMQIVSIFCKSLFTKRCSKCPPFARTHAWRRFLHWSIAVSTSPPQSILGKARRSRTTTQQSIGYNRTSPNSPQELLLPLWRSLPPSNTAIPRPTPLTTLNNIRIQSVIFPQNSFRTDRQTDRHTTRSQQLERPGRRPSAVCVERMR